MPEKKWMSAIISKNNSWLLVATQKKIKRQQLTCVAAGANHHSKKNKKEQSTCGKEKDKTINCLDQKIKWMLHTREEMQSSVKNNGCLLGGDPEEKQKATINLCGRKCKPLQKRTKKNNQPVKKKKKKQSTTWTKWMSAVFEKTTVSSWVAT